MVQMDKLEAMPGISGERIDGLDHCLGGIIQLQKDTELTSEHTTAHEKKIYADASGP
jgi:hypothetical protein